MHAAEKSWRQHQIFAVYSFHTNQFMFGALASFRRLERMAASHPIAEIQTGTLPAIRRKPDPLRRRSRSGRQARVQNADRYAAAVGGRMSPTMYKACAGVAPPPQTA
jgi:hypothetical protein